MFQRPVFNNCNIHELESSINNILTSIANIRIPKIENGIIDYYQFGGCVGYSFKTKTDLIRLTEYLVGDIKLFIKNENYISEHIDEFKSKINNLVEREVSFLEFIDWTSGLKKEEWLSNFHFDYKNITRANISDLVELKANEAISALENAKIALKNHSITLKSKVSMYIILMNDIEEVNLTSSPRLV